MQFGKYTLIDHIGAGGMATVSRARVGGAGGFELEVVLKRIRGDFSEMTTNSLHMLLTEARVSAKLRHPAIVQVYELGEVDGEHYLAMELIDGWDLHAVLRACDHNRRALPLGVTCFIGAQIASALAYAHRVKDGGGRPLGILHRDVSPSNIMVTAAGGVKLLDFGIASVASHLRHDLVATAEHTVKGKVVYMSPEQARGLPLDRRTDQFSLGVVLYELLTHRRPFSGKNAADTMYAVCHSDVTPPSRIAHNVPPELDAVVMRMLARDRHDRYSNCSEVYAALTVLTRSLAGDAAALQSALARLPLEARPTQRVPNLGAITGAHATGSNAMPRGCTLPRMATRSRTAVTLISMVATVTRVPRLVGRAVRRAPRRAAAAAALAALLASYSTRALSRQALPSLVEAHVAAASALGTVHIRVAGSDAAEVVVDGEVVGKVPLQIALPSRASGRCVEVRRPGYQVWTRQIDGHRDVYLDPVFEPSR
jgi:serine/threonine protein kinase